MKIIAKRFYLLLMVLLAIAACNPQPKSTRQADVQLLLDSLKSIYAPDSRIALWNMAITDSSNTISLSGEVDKINAYKGIIEVIGKRFPKTNMDINLLPQNGNSQLVTGLINNSVANLRSNPSHSAEIATQALLGTPIRILKQVGEWYLVQTPNKYIAWIDDDGLVSIDKNDLKIYRQQKKVIYNKLFGFSYTKPNVKSQTVSDLALGCVLPVTGTKRKFYRVQYPDGREAWVLKKECIGFEELLDRNPEETALVQSAKKFNGIPYLWGGTSSKAVDCSGFTSMVYYMNGIILQRDASQQTKYGKEITTTYNWGQLHPGDLLFFGRKASDTLPEKVSHVAMYIGDAEFIHASGKVRINSIDSTSENFIPEYVNRFVRATRVNGHYDNFGVQMISDNEFYKEILSRNED